MAAGTANLCCHFEPAHGDLDAACEDRTDVVIPGEPYTFGVLKRAQALGDLQALRDHGRRVFHIGLGEDVAAGLVRLRDAVTQAP